MLNAQVIPYERTVGSYRDDFGSGTFSDLISDVIRLVDETLYYVISYIPNILFQRKTLVLFQFRGWGEEFAWK